MVSRVLLTGANGFIGAHILEQLLAKGISVRAAVRSQEKANAVAEDHSSAGSLLDFAIVPDITTSGAFDNAFTSEQEFDTVIHTASPFLYRVIKDNSEFINPAVKGTTELLKAVKRFAPSVKRVVITSSFAAVSDFTTSGKIWTGDDWSPITLEKALTGESSDGYRGSKKFAEKAGTYFFEIYL
jgi:nucleoside-diphosphate-sugar epimerase